MARKKKKKRSRKILSVPYIREFLDKEDKRKKRKVNYSKMGIKIEEVKKIPSARWKDDIFIDAYGYRWITGKDYQPVCLGKVEENGIS